MFNVFIILDAALWQAFNSVEPLEALELSKLYCTETASAEHTDDSEILDAKRGYLVFRLVKVDNAVVGVYFWLTRSVLRFERLRVVHRHQGAVLTIKVLEVLAENGRIGI